MTDIRLKDFKVPASVEEFATDMMFAHSEDYFAVHHFCEKCGLPIGWEVTMGDVIYNDSCMCREFPLKESSLKAMFTHLVSQRIPEDYEKALKGMGLYEAYRKNT